MKTFHRLPSLAALSLAMFVAAPAAAHAAEEAPPPNADVTVGVKLDSFKAVSKRTIARGTVTAILTDNKGARTVVKQNVSVEVRAAAGGCKILTLDLEELDLTLLGLNVHLDKVNLAVTGQKNGGVLGRLFCKLASTKLKQRVQAARQLNKRLDQKPMRIMAVTTQISGKVTSAQAPQTCKVLNLVLGPLNLELLGLVVDLNKVKLDITATPGAGALGDLFCQLAGGPSSSTSSQKSSPPRRARRDT